MNQMFQPYLRRFVLVFFDDILICSRSKELEKVEGYFVNLEAVPTFCQFEEVFICINHGEYLGHVVSQKGVTTD